MKKIPALLFALSFCFVLAQVQAQTTMANQGVASPITGAWQSVDQKEFAMLNDGFFSSIAQDSTGKWSATHAGTYTMDDAKTMTLKVLYSSYPNHVGALHTVEYTAQGDNLTLHWFKKLVDAKEGDITAQMPKDSETKYVRAKK